MDRDLLLGLGNLLAKASRAQGVSADALADALAGMEEQSLEDGACLYREGDRSDCLHVLMEGRVRVLAGEQELTTLSAPTIIGQLGVLAGLSRSATVQAMGPIRTARLEDQAMWAMVRDGSDAGQALRRVLLAGLTQLVGQTGARLEGLAGQHGLPLPKGAPRVEPVERPAPRRKPADKLAETFSDSLVAELENLKVVQADADQRKTYKG